jgi:predicted aspartyl protease
MSFHGVPTRALTLAWLLACHAGAIHPRMASEGKTDDGQVAPDARLALSEAAGGLRDQVRAAYAEGRFERVGALAEELEQAGDVGYATLVRATHAERLHEPALLPQPVDAEMSADESGAIALALYSVRGVSAAAPELRSACASTARAPIRTLACALAEQARVIGGRRELSVAAGGEVSVALADASVPVVAASINGLTAEYFVVDTGAANSVLSKRFCDRHGIPYAANVERQALDSAGNIVRLYPAVVERLMIGALVLETVPFFVMDLPEELPLAGIIQPLDTFRHQSLELDLGRRRLQLFGTEAEPLDWSRRWGGAISTVPLIWVGTNVLVAADVRGLAGWFMLDTGASDNLVDVPSARRLGHEPTRLSAPDSIVASGPSATYEGFAAPLTVGRVSAAVSFLVRDEWASDPEQLFPLQRWGTVGSAWFQKRRLALPRGGRQIVFEVGEP